MAFVQWCLWNQKRLPELRTAYAVPNGGNRAVMDGYWLKREGARRGVPDWVLPVSCGSYGGLYIEFKTKGAPVSPDQQEIHALLRNYGNRVEICRSCEAAIAIVEDYLGATSKGTSN